MQSSNFVEGVSGWRIADGRIELYGGPGPIILESAKEADEPQPFIVVDGVTYIREAFIKDGAITKAKIGDGWSVKVEDWSDGRKYVAGIGAGIDPQFMVDAEKFRVECMCSGGHTGDGPKPGDALKAGGASATLDMLAGEISKTELGAGLKASWRSSAVSSSGSVGISLALAGWAINIAMKTNTDSARLKMRDCLLINFIASCSFDVNGTMVKGRATSYCNEWITRVHHIEMTS